MKNVPLSRVKELIVDFAMNYEFDGVSPVLRKLDDLNKTLRRLETKYEKLIGYDEAKWLELAQQEKNNAMCNIEQGIVFQQAELPYFAELRRQAKLWNPDEDHMEIAKDVVMYIEETTDCLHREIQNNKEKLLEYQSMDVNRFAYKQEVDIIKQNIARIRTEIAEIHAEHQKKLQSWDKLQKSIVEWETIVRAEEVEAVVQDRN